MELFAVSRAQRSLVEANRPVIEEKFRVGVQLCCYAEPMARGSVGEERRDSVSCVLRAPQTDCDEYDSTRNETEQIWVEIEGDPSKAAQAKKCILSLCQPQDDLKILETLPHGFGELLHDQLDRISARTNAKFEYVQGQDDALFISGNETSIAMALSLIEGECNIFRTDQSWLAADQPEDTTDSSLERSFVSSLDRVSPPAKDSPTLPLIPLNIIQKRTVALLDSRIESVLSVRGPAPGKDPNEPRQRGDSPRLIAHSVRIPRLEDHTGPSQRPELHVSEPAAYDIALTETPQSLSVINSMQKLGYSKEKVDLILRQLGPDADLNDVLGALVNQRPTRVDTEDTDIKYEAGSDDLSYGFIDEEDGLMNEDDNLRTIIIDGSNLAMSFGNKDVFACKGIEIAVNWFQARGHKNIHVFVPSWRKEASKPESPITDQEILFDLERKGYLSWTPCRRINGRRIVCYDDRYILKTAVKEKGIIVSNDNFRDIQNDDPEWKKVIEERLLLFIFVNDTFMPPDDPLGKHGPSLDNLLRLKPTLPDHLPQACPYGKKCTYGNKCKYYHADRPNRPIRSISETLKERDKTRKERANLSQDRSSSRSKFVSSAPIPGYAPPEEIAPTPERHTTPLPGPDRPRSSKNVLSQAAGESGQLQQENPNGTPQPKTGWPEPTTLYPTAVDGYTLLNRDFQRYHTSPPLPSMKQTRSMTAPMPTGYAQHLSALPQRDTYTVPLQRSPLPHQQPDAAGRYGQTESRKRFSMPPGGMLGSGEPLGSDPLEVETVRVPSCSNLSLEFQHLAILESSGVTLPREPGHVYTSAGQEQGQEQGQQRYHLGAESFSSQPHSAAHQPTKFSQGADHPILYNTSESFFSQPTATISDNQHMFPNRHPQHTSRTQQYPPPSAYHTHSQGDVNRLPPGFQSDSGQHHTSTSRHPPGFHTPPPLPDSLSPGQSSYRTPSPVHAAHHHSYPSIEPGRQPSAYPNQMGDYQQHQHQQHQQHQQPYYRPVARSGGPPYMPSPVVKPLDVNEQRKHIFRHLSKQFGLEKVEAVMLRHPQETNPQKLIKYMSMNM